MRRMRDEVKTSCLKRLKRIEGQIRGLATMVEEDRYCIDVVTQIAAARAALRRVEEEVLRDHVAHCVEHAISSGDKADQRRKITELMDVIGRAIKRLPVKQYIAQYESQLAANVAGKKVFQKRAVAKKKKS